MWYSGSSLSGVGGIGFAAMVDAVPGYVVKPGGEKGDLVLYPNPARTSVYIETGREEAGTVEILSINGQVLFMETPGRGTREIDVSGIPRGLYIVKVKLESEILTGKLFIE